MTPKLSTGDDSTLGNWIKLSTTLWGEDSAQVRFLREKAAASPHGEAEPVIADEGQLLHVLASLK